MAKKRKNLKRKHNQDNHQSDFLADIPESTDQSEWSPSMDMHSSPQTQENHPNDTSPQENIEDSSQNEHNENPTETETNSTSENKQQKVNENEDGVILGHTVGPYLKKEREKLGIQLNFVVQSTKISLTNLENLEADNLEGLPDKAYVTGYVKSYSKLLNLNTGEALKLLDYTYEKLGKSQGPQEIVIPQAQNAPKVSMPLPWAKIGIAAGVLLLLAAIGAAGWTFLSRSVEDKVQTSQVKEERVVEKPKNITPQSLTAETPLQEELSEATPIIDEAQAQAEDEAPVSTKNEEAKKIETKKEEPVAKVEEKKKEVKETTKDDTKKDEKDEKIKFYGMSSNLYQYDNDLSEDQINELLPSRFRVTPSKGILAVFITATKGDSWLTYKSDDDDIRKFVLKKGRSILIRGKLTRVFLGNVGAVKIFLDNRPLKITSSSGVKSLIFPQEKSSDYVTPLFIYKKDGSVITSEEYLTQQGND